MKQLLDTFPAGRHLQKWLACAWLSCYCSLPPEGSLPAKPCWWCPKSSQVGPTGVFWWHFWWSLKLLVILLFLIFHYILRACFCVGQPLRNRLSTLQLSTLSDVHMASVSTCKLTAVWMEWHVYRDPGSISCPAVSTLRKNVQTENAKLPPAPSSALWLVYGAEIKQWEGLRQNTATHTTGLRREWLTLRACTHL